MNHLRYAWRTLFNVGPILGLTFALAGHAQSMSGGPGEAAFHRACSTCHSLTIATAHRLSYSGWESVVQNMVSRGAPATPDEQEQIVRYLTLNFGVGTVPGGALAPAETQAAPVLDTSQIAKAKDIIKTNGCLSCHRVNDNGSFAGPYLGDVGANDTAEQIRTALVSPGKELAPQNRSVRLVTLDGKTVVGKLLNQDAFSVQLIDASGHLLTFERANLREFTIITANSMPSYANKMASENLSLLVKYLETLTGTSQQ